MAPRPPTSFFKKRDASGGTSFSSPSPLRQYNWERPIFTKFSGALTGLLLVVYGAFSLWLGRSSQQPGAPANDSRISVDYTLHRSLAQAKADLIQSPASAYRWADLADSEINANNLDHGKFCIRQAVAAAPGNPAILFRAANLYLRLENYPETLVLLTSILRNPELTPFYNRVFLLYSQMDLPLEELLKQGLPQTPASANAFLRFWIDQGKLEEAQETWNWINANSLTGLESAGSYVELLSKSSRWEEALESWATYTTRLDPEYSKTNWIYNGSFEMKPVKCPFDWHLQSSNNVTVDRDADVSYHGGRSLRLTFSGNTEHASAYQNVLLQSGLWEVRASMRTRRLTSDQGVVIRVVDANAPARLDVATNSLQGTEDWTTVSKKFEVKPATQLVRVEIIRPKSREFDSSLQGTAWIDSVELHPVWKSISVKAAGLANSGQPCERDGGCGYGQTGVESTPK